MVSPNVTRGLARTTGGPVEAIEQIGGSTSASVWRCATGDRDRRLVVKVYDIAELVGMPYDARWDLTVAAAFLPRDGETLMVGNELGAGLSRAGIRRSIEAIVRAAVG